MVQNIQKNNANEIEIGGRTTGGTASKKLKTQIDTLKVIACPVCRAVYMPFFREGKSAQSLNPLLETAFLSVCRFCFRCQRPACPQCWNREHNLCAACSQEIQVSFHVPLPSFEGLVFSPLLSLHKEAVADVSFICRRNGRFASPELVSEETLLPTCLPVEKSGPAADYPGWLQEVMSQKAGKQQPAKVFQAAENLQNSEPVSTGKSLDLPSTNALEWPSVTQEEDVAVKDVSISEVTQNNEKLPLIERIENVLIVLVSIILVALILMIVLAVGSADMNAFFLRLFHIDIRAEIAYLLKLI
ncbi:MAG TPA: hypothetical protein VFN35_25100 [Ktedonobacteraceae bacterium]|nr:hypothetical protein [Ktedonobacteraceae bacterium]